MANFRNDHQVLAVFVTLVGLLTSLIGCGTSVAQEAATTEGTRLKPDVTWLIVRHSERDGSNDALTERGHERAKQLATLAKVLRVSAIYSTDLQRTRGTAQPTADSGNLEIQKYQQITAEWINKVRQANAGGVVLIVGHSNTVGPIVSELAGVESFEIPHDQYDLLYIVKEQVTGTSLVQLYYGDSNKTHNPATPEQTGPIKMSENKSRSKE
ncbi:MAG: histidine phosphatase family protein [Planctomycetaceae bacterium]|nr:histidine phosphatase family protein [Planctomycetaceae bacterium]